MAAPNQAPTLGNDLGLQHADPVQQYQRRCTLWAVAPLLRGPAAPPDVPAVHEAMAIVLDRMESANMVMTDVP